LIGASWVADGAGGAAGTEPPAGVAVAPVLADAAPSARAGSRPALNLISTPVARLNSSTVIFIQNVNPIPVSNVGVRLNVPLKYIGKLTPNRANVFAVNFFSMASSGSMTSVF